DQKLGGSEVPLAEVVEGRTRCAEAGRTPGTIRRDRNRANAGGINREHFETGGDGGDLSERATSRNARSRGIVACREGKHRRIRAITDEPKSSSRQKGSVSRRTAESNNFQRL